MIKSGNLIAGTDGSGLVYRISPSGEGFALYSAPKKEITALAVDAQGNIYAAGAGDKRGGSAPHRGRTSRLGPSQAAPHHDDRHAAGAASQAAAGGPPAIAPTPYPSVVNLGGSEIYRIAPDGSPKTIWTSKDDLVYAMAFDANGRLLAGTGNKGKLYAIGERDYTDLTLASANQVTASGASAPQGGLYAATSNLGKVFLIGAKLRRRGNI